LLDRKGRTGQQLGPNDLEQRHEHECANRRQRQHYQRFEMAARQYAVEHLQYEERRRQKQQIDDEAEQPGGNKMDPKTLYESPHIGGRPDWFNAMARRSILLC
jgi:hypothetical protein